MSRSSFNQVKQTLKQTKFTINTQPKKSLSQSLLKLRARRNQSLQRQRWKLWIKIHLNLGFHKKEFKLIKSNMKVHLNEIWSLSKFKIKVRQWFKKMSQLSLRWLILALIRKWVSDLKLIKIYLQLTNSQYCLQFWRLNPF